MSLININQFGFNVGAHGAKIKSAAEPLRKAFVAADNEVRKAMRRQWMLGHLAGASAQAEADTRQVKLDKVDPAKHIANAEKVLNAGKGNGASKANIAAIDRASSDFAYHIGSAVKSNKAEPTKVRISAAERAAFEAFKKVCGDRMRVVFKALA